MAGLTKNWEQLLAKMLHDMMTHYGHDFKVQICAQKVMVGEYYAILLWQCCNVCWVVYWNFHLFIIIFPWIFSPSGRCFQHECLADDAFKLYKTCSKSLGLRRTIFTSRTHINFSKIFQQQSKCIITNIYLVNCNISNSMLQWLVIEGFGLKYGWTCCILINIWGRGWLMGNGAFAHLSAWNAAE